MAERIKPAIVTEEMFNQVVVARRVKEAQQELAPEFDTRTNDLIRKIIPQDPRLTQGDRVQVDKVGGEVSIDFVIPHDENEINPHTIPGDELVVALYRGSYPRDEKGIPESTTMKVGEGNLYLISKERITFNGRPLGRRELEGFMGLLNYLGEGFESGELTTVVHSPKPSSAEI